MQKKSSSGSIADKRLSGFGTYAKASMANSMNEAYAPNVKKRTKKSQVGG